MVAPCCWSVMTIWRYRGRSIHLPSHQQFTGYLHQPPHFWHHNPGAMMYSTYNSQRKWHVHLLTVILSISFRSHMNIRLLFIFISKIQVRTLLFDQMTAYRFYPQLTMTCTHVYPHLLYHYVIILQYTVYGRQMKFATSSQQQPYWRVPCHFISSNISPNSANSQLSSRPNGE